MQGWVTSPSTEIADDLTAVRMGMRHRLQTKRGPLGERSGSSIGSRSTPTPPGSPTPDRDNVGEPFGMLDYDLRWHLGDRFSILSDGDADTFGDGLRTASIGVLLNRPTRGNAYLGFRTFGGIIEPERHHGHAQLPHEPEVDRLGRRVVRLRRQRQHQPIVRLHAASANRSIVDLGANYDESKDNVGVSFLVEPRFLPKLNVTRRTGIEIPPVGAYGLE